MSYIADSLTQDEEILLNFQLHKFWTIKLLQALGYYLAGILIFLAMVIPDPDVGMRNFHILVIVMSLVSLLLLAFFFIRAYLKSISTEQAITNKRVIFKTGYFSTRSAELRNENIENVSIQQGILGKILNFGGLVFVGRGGSPVTFLHIKDPVLAKRNIDEAIFKHKE